ncbi:GIP, partial [Symbiodinium microadriaticum]
KALDSESCLRWLLNAAGDTLNEATKVGDAGLENEEILTGLTKVRQNVVASQEEFALVQEDGSVRRGDLFGGYEDKRINCGKAAWARFHQVLLQKLVFASRTVQEGTNTEGIWKIATEVTFLIVVLIVITVLSVKDLIPFWSGGTKRRSSPRIVAEFQCWLSIGIEAFMSKMNTYGVELVSVSGFFDWELHDAQLKEATYPNAEEAEGGRGVRQGVTAWA